MILVLVGNWHKGFDRLVEAVDKQIALKEIKEPVIMQIGHGQYRPQNATWFEFCSPEQCEEYIRQSRIVIAHAGMGTIASTIRYGKPIVVLPRKPSLGEIYDNHQQLTVKQLVQEGKILAAFEVSDLPALLKKAETFIPVGTQTSPELIEFVEQYFYNLQNSKKEKCSK